jgi:hypothetical protein
MKTFVLIVIFAADLTGGARTERIASFDDYHSCVLAARSCTRRSIGSVWRKTNRQDQAAGV